MNKPAKIIAMTFAILAFQASSLAAGVNWTRKSTTTGDLQPPNSGTQQTCLVAADFDKDGIVDFAIGERTKAPSVVWYKFNGTGWDRKIVDDSLLKPEAGGDTCDIDQDGDLDLILGQDYSGSAMWWWENPYPDFTNPWKRRLIKNSGARKHHDQTVGDFDGDGQPELLSWNQSAKELLLFEIPQDPKSTEPWQSRAIYTWTSGAELEGFPSRPVDVDGDGRLDVVGGGRWFKYQAGGQFEATVVDDEMRFTQCSAGQLVKGGWAELVFSPGDTDGEARWYRWDGTNWIGQSLGFVIHGHTCEIGDVDADGNLDIMIGEMGRPGAGDGARTWVWYGDGQGNFRKTVASSGQGIHEGKLGDFNGDGRVDILLKPYSHNTPRVDVLLNTPAPERATVRGEPVSDPSPSRDLPVFWKSRLEDVESEAKAVSKGESRVIARSPGGLPVYAVSYGKKQDSQSQANYNSAVAASNAAYYARKQRGTKPVVMFLGPVHGQEIENIVGLVNLIRVAETGKDFRGRDWTTLQRKIEAARVIIIPVANPDGRKRCPYDSFVGLPLDTMTKYGQGTRRNGTIYGWPGGKSVHPMKGDVGILGAYFNDNGVNIMHDEFFAPMAEETKAVLELTRTEAPDMVVSLHSHGSNPTIVGPSFVPVFMKERVQMFARRLEARFKKAGLPFGRVFEVSPEDPKFPPTKYFNLVSAMHHASGAMAFTFECTHGAVSQALSLPKVDHEQILDIQLALFDEMLSDILENRFYWEPEGR